jgi:hypothetical protein
MPGLRCVAALPFQRQEPSRYLLPEPWFARATSGAVARARGATMGNADETSD